MPIYMIWSIISREVMAKFEPTKFDQIYKPMNTILFAIS